MIPTGDTAPYLDDGEYLRDYLALLSLQLHREVLLTRALRGDHRQESFLGLFMTEDDIAAILAELHGAVVQDFPDGEFLTSRIAVLKDRIEQRLAITEWQQLAWRRLARVFQLNQTEAQLLLLTLAPEIDGRFGQAYAYLHDDVSRRHMSGALAEKLLHDQGVTALTIRRALHQAAILRKCLLLELQDDTSIPLMGRGLKLSSRTSHALLGLNEVDDELIDRLLPPVLEDIKLQPDALTQSVMRAAEHWQQEPLPIWLQPEANADLDLWLQVFGEQIQTGVLNFDWQLLVTLPAKQAERMLRILIREAHISNQLVHIFNFSPSAGELQVLLMHLLTPLVCLSGLKSGHVDWQVPECMRVTVPVASTQNRLQCWRAMNRFLPGLSDETLTELAQLYNLGTRSLSALVRSLPVTADGESVAANLAIACRQEVSQRMAEVAQRVSSPFEFKDIVLPPSNLQALNDIVTAQRDRDIVMQEWGLGEVFYQGEASAVLFVGPSGTGKTMAAGVLANTLGLDMYRVDLAGVVSKYIGETEKNLDRIFAVASTSQVVLFIDEADALFGKRTEVKDAHDRYANLEVSYLLQKMEQHTGLVILASNLGQNIDEAFSRRFSSVIEFALPKAAERLALWQKLLATRAPLSDNLDLSFLAERFEISGGYIRNCILTAAYQAAAQNEPINMQMLIRALSKEYNKIGKPISKSSFGDYYAALRRDVASGH